MGKLLLFVILGMLAYMVFKGSVRRNDRQAEAAPRSPEAMVECAHCHLHVPLGESLAEGAKHYCCEEHRRLGHG